MTPEREEAYRAARVEMEGITEGEPDWIANLANIAAILYEKLPFSWVGFYRVTGEDLVLGPFQGPTACVRVARGAGVCGAALERDEVLVVPDVNSFDGHIACDPRSRSEVVVPIHAADGSTWGVLDVDSHEPADFDDDDATALIDVVELVEKVLAR